jgi:hypothetical protein
MRCRNSSGLRFRFPVIPYAPTVPHVVTLLAFLRALRVSAVNEG